MTVKEVRVLATTVTSTLTALAVGYDHELVVNGQSGLAVRHVCRYVLLRTVSVNGFDGNAGGFKPLPLDVRKLRGFAHKNKLRDKLGVNLYAPSRGQLGFPLPYM